MTSSRASITSPALALAKPNRRPTAGRSGDRPVNLINLIRHIRSSGSTTPKMPPPSVVRQRHLLPVLPAARGQAGSGQVRSPPCPALLDFLPPSCMNTPPSRPPRAAAMDGPYDLSWLRATLKSSFAEPSSDPGFVTTAAAHGGGGGPPLSPAQRAYLLRLITAIRAGRTIATSYNKVLVAVLVFLTIRHWAGRYIKARRRAAKQEARAVGLGARRPLAVVIQQQHPRGNQHAPERPGCEGLGH